MKLLKLLLLGGALFGMSASAKIVIKEDRLDSCLIEVRYERTIVLDTLDAQNNSMGNYITLRAGKNAAAFYSAKRKNFDSISARNFEIVVALMSDKDAFRKFSNEEQQTIFRIKTNNTTLVQDRFDLTSWYYEEPIPNLKWEITDSIKVINSLNCVQARTDFRGRTWIVWFSPEIPISEGPWKLNGLPGLIIWAYDSKGHYQYLAKDINTTPRGYVDYFDYSDRIKTNRMEALKTKHKVLKESLVDKLKSLGVINPTNVSQGKSESKQGRNYDFEEIDYPHV